MLRLLGDSRETSRSPKKTAPEVCFSRPAMIRISVVLPQPDGPRRQGTWPLGKANETSATACNEPNVLVSCSTRISAMEMGTPGDWGLGTGRPLGIDWGRYRSGRWETIAAREAGGWEASAPSQPLAGGCIEQREVVGKDGNRHRLVQIVATLVVAVD